MQPVWASVVLSQTGVLCAYQLGFVPPAQGIEWAYALLAGLCGLGPVVLRHGPGALPMQSMRNARSSAGAHVHFRGLDRGRDLNTDGP
jgi:hypothetical protein